MTPMQEWSEIISILTKMNIDNMPLPEKRKEAMKEYVDATKELFINNDEKTSFGSFCQNYWFIERATLKYMSIPFRMEI